MPRYFRVSSLLCFLISGAYPISAQTFNGQGGLLVPPGAPAQTVGITTSPCVVSGIGILGNGCTLLDHLTLDFTHTFVGDVAIFVIAPTGQVLELSSSNGGAGDNYQITTFTDNTALFITSGAPPYNGTFRPEGRQQSTTPPFPNGAPLGTFTFANTFNGLNADGVWTLLINDYVAIDVGVLNAWSLTFTAGGGPPPSVNLGPDITICPGQSSTLTATVTPGATSYSWSTGESSSSIIVAPVVNTTYMVTVTNNGCIDADTIQVIVNPNGINANAGADVAICSGSSTTLNGSGGGPSATYNWSSGQSGQSINVTPGSSTTYTLTVTDGACSSTDQVVVTVNPIPNANAGPDEIICDGESVTLTASGGVIPNNYLWSTGQSGASITVSPNTNTIYTVTVTVNGCSDTDIVEVEVNPEPTVDAGQNVMICDGESADLSANGSGGTYTWSTGQSGSDITVSPSTTTTYTVTLNDNGCTATDNVTVTVGDIQADIFAADDEICDGAFVVLVASGGTSYEWSTGETGSNIQAMPNVTTTYTVTVTQGNCTDEASFTLNVIATPEGSVETPVPICAGESTTLIAESTVNNVDYSWSTGQSGSTITVFPNSTTTYSVTVDNNGCLDVVTVEVDVLPGPSAFAGGDEVICPDEEIELTADGGGTYDWSTGESTESILVSPSGTTTYTVTVTDGNGCTDADAVIVNVSPEPAANAGPDQIICDGDNATLTGSGGLNYDWSTGDGTQTIVVTPILSTSYTLTVTDINGCTGTDLVNVTVNPIPLANAGPNVFIVTTQSATLNATGGGTYLWSTGETTSQITVMPTTTTVYSVTVTVNGCTSVDDVTVFVNQAPDVDLGSDLIICEGETVSIDATIPGPFNFQFAWSTGESTAIINVSPTDTTAYSVTATDLNTNFSTIDTVLVTVIPLPVGNPTIIGLTTLCLDDLATYSIATVTNATNYSWTLPAGATLISGQGTTSIDVDWDNAVGGLVEVVASNSCGSLPASTINIVINTPPVQPGPINGQLDPCADGSSTYTIPALPDADDYQWTLTGGGTLVSGQGTTSIAIDWNGSAGGDVCLTASNECGTSNPVCISVATTLTPSLNAGPDIVTCGLNTNLNAAGTGSWSILSGPGTIQFSDLYSPTASAQATEPGSYVLSYSYSQNGCMAEDQVQVVYNEEPFIQNDITDCNDINTAYAVTFEINGGTGPYLVNGIPFTGGVYTSTDILSGNPYSFSIEDANGCVSQTITGQVTCNCTSASGAMDVNQINACIDVQVSAIYLGGEILDGNDKLAFILHDGNIPSGIIAWNTSPDFAFVSPMQTGVTYYISAVVGDGDANGLPVLNDPCGSVSPGTPIIFHDFPIADAGEDKLLGCQPNTIQLNANGSSIGAEIVYEWKAENGGIIQGTSNGNVINAAAGGSYILTVQDLISGCASYDTAIVTPSQLSFQNLQVDVTSPLCIGDCNGVIQISNAPAEWLFDYGDGIFVSNTSIQNACAGAASIAVQDTFGCVKDTAITVIAPELVTVDLGPDQSIDLGESVTLQAASVSTLVAYNWFAADPCMTCPQITVSPTETTVYNVEVTDVNDCIASDDITITILFSNNIYVPSVFSPNNDQVNDIFFIGGSSDLKTIESFEIFDRWGELVFEKHQIDPGDPSQGWDGTAHGERVNPGVFVYQAEVVFSNGKKRILHGDITLIR